MKISLSPPEKIGKRSAYTLLEIMISSSVMSIALVAFSFSVSQGGRISELVNGKLSYTADAQYLLSQIVPTIREAKDVELGLWSGGVFSPVTNNNARVAHAIRVFATTNTTQFTVYYLDTSDDTLKSYVNGASQNSRLMGTITNTTPFSKEDFRGNVLTNDPSNFVLGIDIEMKDTVFGNALSDGNYQFDNFRLTTKVTRRMVE